MKNSTAANKIKVIPVSLKEENKKPEQSTGTNEDYQQQQQQRRLVNAQEGVKEWVRFTDIWSRRSKEVLK